MSTDSGSNEEDEAVDAKPQTNFERLIAHLRKDSLAEKLVSAYAEAEQDNAVQAIKDVMASRLDELKRNYDAPEDQQD